MNQMDSDERKRKLERAHEKLDRLTDDDLVIVRRLMDRLLADSEQKEQEGPGEDSSIRDFLRRRKLNKG